MKRIAFPAMGTEVVGFGDDPAGLARYFAAAESVFSRFDPDSQLSELNRSQRHTVGVTPEMAACLRACRELSLRTAGLVDPGVANAVIGWGYDRSFAEIVDRDHADSDVEMGRWLISGSTVYRQPGVNLDLGGFAKGWTADRAVEQGLARLVSAGGDVRSTDPDATISIEDPWGQTAATILLGVGGLATSSSTRRRWRVGDVDAHHIIDPRRLQPAASPVFSATVTAATAVEAEAGAKAVLLHGENGLAWAQQQDWIRAALVVWHDGNVYATTGWELAA